MENFRTPVATPVATPRQWLHSGNSIGSARKHLQQLNDSPGLETPLLSSAEAKRSREPNDSLIMTASGAESPLKRRVLEDAYVSPPAMSRRDLLKEQNFGFPMTASDIAHASNPQYVRGCYEQKARWDEFFVQYPFMSDRDEASLKLENGSKVWRHVRDLCRMGVPIHRRRCWWQILSGAINKRKSSPANYSSILASSRAEGKSWIDIEKDIKRTFPDHPRFRSREGQDELRRVLRAYSSRNPDVGYCQSMNFIAGTLLLFMSEEETFWTFSAIMEDRMPENFYNKSMQGLRIDIVVFEKLVEQELPRLYAHLTGMDIAPQTFVAQCFACIFINVLPIECALRVWDAFLCEGSKVLFRVSLALFRLKEKDILQITDPIMIHQFMFAFPKDIDSSTLMNLVWEDQPPPVFAPFSPIAHLKTKLRRGRRISVSIAEFREQTHVDNSSCVIPPLDPPSSSKKLQMAATTSISALQEHSATLQAKGKEILTSIVPDRFIQTAQRARSTLHLSGFSKLRADEDYYDEEEAEDCLNNNESELDSTDDFDRSTVNNNNNNSLLAPKLIEIEEDEDHFVNVRRRRTSIFESYDKEETVEDDKEIEKERDEFEQLVYGMSTPSILHEEKSTLVEEDEEEEERQSCDNAFYLDEEDTDCIDDEEEKCIKEIRSSDILGEIEEGEEEEQPQNSSIMSNSVDWLCSNAIPESSISTPVMAKSSSSSIQQQQRQLNMHDMLRFIDSRYSTRSVIIAAKTTPFRSTSIAGATAVTKGLR